MNTEYLLECCYCTSKTRKSESNSQLDNDTEARFYRCYCTSKTRKSESNSQHGVQNFRY